MRRNTVLTSLVVAAALSRLLPHPPNFTAVGAIALFSGATFASRRMAAIVPLAALLLSDLLLGLFVYGIADAFRWVLPVYGCMALTVLLGRWCHGWRGVAGGVVGATLLFYLGTNATVWASGMFYPLTGAGLLACYAAALPFALNMLLANALFAAALFGLLALAERRDLVPATASPS